MPEKADQKEVVGLVKGRQEASREEVVLRQQTGVTGAQTGVFPYFPDRVHAFKADRVQVLSSQGNGKVVLMLDVPGLEECHDFMLIGDYDVIVRPREPVVSGPKAQVKFVKVRSKREGTPATAVQWSGDTDVADRFLAQTYGQDWTLNADNTISFGGGQMAQHGDWLVCYDAQIASNVPFSMGNYEFWSDFDPI